MIPLIRSQVVGKPFDHMGIIAGVLYRELFPLIEKFEVLRMPAGLVVIAPEKKGWPGDKALWKSIATGTVTGIEAL